MIVAAAKGTTCSGTRGTFDTGFDGRWPVCHVPDRAGITVRATGARHLGRPVSRVAEGARLSDMSVYHNTSQHGIGITNTTRWSEAKPR